jgi:hypothetical protein
MVILIWYEIEGILENDHVSHHVNTRAQMSKVISFPKLTSELGLMSYTSRFLNCINAPSMTYSGWWVTLSMTSIVSLHISNVTNKG